MFLLFCIANLCFDSYYDIRGKIPLPLTSYYLLIILYYSSKFNAIRHNNFVTLQRQAKFRKIYVKRLRF